MSPFPVVWSKTLTYQKILDGFKQAGYKIEKKSNKQYWIYSKTKKDCWTHFWCDDSLLDTRVDKDSFESETTRIIQLLGE